MKKAVLITGGILLILIGGIAILRLSFGGGEDTWICENDQWVKHGQPSAPAPESGCGQEQTEKEASPVPVGLANPASVSCGNQDGTLEIKTDETGGQTGICKFANGSECEEWQLFRGECRPAPTDCAASPASATKKEVRIKIEDIKNPESYISKRREAVNLINQCYEVNLIEEYEVQPGEVSTQGGTFKNKISANTEVFKKLKFYPKMELADYEGVALDNGLIYRVDDYTAAFAFYRDSQVEGFRSTPTTKENELRWTDIETTNQIISVEFTPPANGQTQALVKFNFIQPLGAE